VRWASDTFPVSKRRAVRTLNGRRSWATQDSHRECRLRNKTTLGLEFTAFSGKPIHAESLEMYVTTSLFEQVGLTDSVTPSAALGIRSEGV
jgi:hypothetical protein